MKRLKTTIGTAMAICVCTGLLGTGTASAAHGYRAYVSCASAANSKSTDTCLSGSSVTAFFISRTVAVRYRVCVKYPSGVRGCTKRRSAKAGLLYANPIPSDQVGSYRAVWYVGDKKLRVRLFTITG